MQFLKFFIKNTICYLLCILKMVFPKHSSSLIRIRDHVWGKNMSHETEGWVDIPHVLCIWEWCIQLKSWVPTWPHHWNESWPAWWQGFRLNQIHSFLKRLSILHGKFLSCKFHSQILKELGYSRLGYKGIKRSVSICTRPGSFSICCYWGSLH